MVSSKKSYHKSAVTGQKRHLLKWLVLGLILLAGLVTILEVTNTTTLFHNEPEPAAGPGTLEKGRNTTSTPAENKNETNSSSKEPTTEDPQPTPGTPPKTPVGNFVSSHYAGLGDTEQSTCNTTPGANCTITFTKDGVAKSLPIKKADGEGSVIWVWKPSDIGLTVGSWKVTAVASVGDQQTTAEDAIALEVSP